MAAAAIGEAEATARTALSASLGSALSAAAVLFLGIDSGARILLPALMAAYSPARVRLRLGPLLPLRS